MLRLAGPALLRLLPPGRVEHGQATLRVLADNDGIQSALRPKGVDFRTGAAFTDTTIVEAVLRAVREYKKPSDGGECRFDYTLKYKTHDDYYEGRERFEKYFYSAARAELK